MSYKFPYLSPNICAENISFLMYFQIYFSHFLIFKINSIQFTNVVFVNVKYYNYIITIIYTKLHKQITN